MAVPSSLLVEAIAALIFFVIVSVHHRMPRGGAAAGWAAFWLLRGVAACLIPMEAAASLRSLSYGALQLGSAALLAILVVRFSVPRPASHGDRDVLTGLLNRSVLERILDAPLSGPGIVVVCDLDRFKPLNDSHGHLVGDEVLRGVGALIAASIRKEDMAFRWGGDEFVICFASADEEIVWRRMRSIEERLARFHVRAQQAVPVGVSWGLFRYAGGPLRDAIEQADLSMYEAKRARSTGTAVAETRFGGADYSRRGRP
jgi:diguanylate cyclase (GGDEF)-like protein